MKKTLSNDDFPDLANKQILTQEAIKFKSAEEFVNSKINAFHTTTGKFDVFNIPTFFCRNKKDAEEYGGLKAEKTKTIGAFIDIKHPFRTGYNEEQSTEFIALINRAGFKVDKIVNKSGAWSISEEQTKPIRDNSPYDGENLNDWIYVPKVREQLIKESYDGLEASDVFSNHEIDIIIPLNTNQIFTESQLADIWNKAHEE